MTLLDDIVACRPLVTGLRLQVGEPTTVELEVPAMRPRDIDVFLDGERIAGLKSVQLAARSVIGYGVLRVRRFSREWHASATPVELSLAVRDPDSGDVVVCLDLGRVLIGEPVGVDAKHIDVPLQKAS